MNSLDSIMEALKQDALRTIKLSSPVRTGNLQNAVKVRNLPNGKGFEIYIDTTQASYAEATIDPWVHDRWHGRENPNEGWTNEAAHEFIERARIKYKGNVVKTGVLKDRGE